MIMRLHASLHVATPYSQTFASYALASAVIAQGNEADAYWIYSAFLRIIRHLDVGGLSFIMPRIQKLVAKKTGIRDEDDDLGTVIGLTSRLFGLCIGCTWSSNVNTELFPEKLAILDVVIDYIAKGSDKVERMNEIILHLVSLYLKNAPKNPSSQTLNAWTFGPIYAKDLAKQLRFLFLRT
jgi:hypothetical protein